MDIRDLGIGKDSICEAVVTTFHSDGSPNAAPMGVSGAGRDHIMMKVHRDTDTYENILRGRCCVINIVFDPLLFLRCALYGRHKGPLEVEVLEVEQADSVEAPYLADANAYVEAELVGCEEFIKRDDHGRSVGARMTLAVKNIEVLSPFPVAPNRGFFASVELAISLSRKKTGDVHRHLSIIKKTLPADQAGEIERFVKDYLPSIP